MPRDKSTIFTSYDGKIVGIFVGNSGDGLGLLLQECYPTHEEVVRLISFGAVESMGESVERSVFYVPQDINNIEDLEIWEGDDTADFLSRYGLPSNYYFDAIMEEWILLSATKDTTLMCHH